MNLGPVLICALLAAPAARLGAQTQASLGVGVGTVRYTRGASFSAASVMPAVERLTPSLYLGGSAMLSVLGDGAWAGQARADLWAASPPLAASTRFALSAGGAAATRSDGLASAAGSLLGEIVYTAPRGGGAVGIGSVGGVLEGAPAVGGLRVRARVWWQRQADYATLSVESTRFFGAWYSDLLVGYTIERPRVSASVWLNGRVSGTYTSSAAASASLRYFVTPTVALEAAGGSYLRDPFQGLPRAGFITAAVRLFQAPRELLPTVSTRPRPRPGPPPLIAQRRGGGDTVVVRFRMDARRSLAIAGDWNAWAPVPLRPLGDDIWEAVLVLPRGTYHFNLLVDEEEWVVPGGVAVISDGLGGLVAVLTVL